MDQVQKIPSQNLIKQVSQDEIARPRGFYTSIVFDVLSVLSAIGLAYAYKGFMGKTISYDIFLGALIGFTTVSVLQSLVRRDVGRKIFVFLLETASFGFFFYGANLTYYVWALIALFVFLILGDVSARSVLDNSLEIRFMRVARAGLAQVTTGAILFMLLMYLPQVEAGNAFISQGAFDSIFQTGASIVHGLYPELNINSSIDAFAASIVHFELSNDQRFKDLSKDAQVGILGQSEKQILDSLKNMFGSFESGDSFGSVLYKFFLGKLQGWESQYPQIFLGVWIVIAFFIIRSLAALFNILAAFVAFVFYELLIAFNVIHLESQTQSQEVIDFS